MPSGSEKPGELTERPLSPPRGSLFPRGPERFLPAPSSLRRAPETAPRLLPLQGAEELMPEAGAGREARAGASPAGAHLLGAGASAQLGPMEGLEQQAGRRLRLNCALV